MIQVGVIIYVFAHTVLLVFIRSTWNKNRKQELEEGLFEFVNQQHIVISF